jgi:hypothetical protein
MDTLALDNYVYLGMHIWNCQPSLFSFLNLAPNFPFEQDPNMTTMTTTMTTAFSSTFLNELNEAHSQGQNVIIMDESFKGYTTAQQNLIMDEFASNWNVKLIFNYRRAYEFLPSDYNQMHKPFRTTRINWNLWPGETSEDGLVIGEPLVPFNIDGYRSHEQEVDLVSFQQVQSISPVCVCARWSVVFILWSHGSRSSFERKHAHYSTAAHTQLTPHLFCSLFVHFFQ